MNSKKSRQTGLTLLELLFALFISTVITLISFQSQTLQREQEKARVAGGKLFEYNNAAREWLSANIGAAPATQNGTAWLKSTACPGGTGAVNYLPCSFPDFSAGNPLPSGKLALTSTITTTGTPPNQVTTVTTVATPYTLKSGQIRSDLSGLAAIVASAGSKTVAQKGGTDGTYNSNISTGVITLTASNQATTDAWLRTDGSNTMNGNLQFQAALPAAQREIRGASSLQNIAANVLSVGNSGGAAAGYSVIVDAQQNILGNIRVQNVQNAAYGVDVTRGSIRTQNGNLRASGQLIAGNQMIAPAFYDSNNLGYYLDPNGTSQLYQGFTTGGTNTPIVYDANDPNYYLDPNGYSYLNSMQVQSLAVWGNMSNWFRTWANAGLQVANPVGQTACPKLGLMTAFAGGGIASCYDAGAYGHAWFRQPYAKQSLQTVFHAVGTTNTEENKPIGQHFFCALVGFQSSTVQDHTCDLTGDFSGWYLKSQTYNKQTTDTASSNLSDHWCYAQCIDFN